MSRFEPGQVVSGKYRVVRLIGDGGMGVVYEARHEVLGSSVALKFLHADLAKRPGLTERFLQEARVSATIQSPHVTRVTDVDKAQDGSPYLVMELLSGESLQTLLDRRGRLPQDQAVDFGLQILAGLEAAHAIGVVHRDLKPDNVFITPSGGGPLLKLIDFGIAKLRASSEYTRGLTRAGVIMGTPEYMAPEQLMSAHTTDHRADIYSLGVMLFEMLAGCRPADGDDAELIVAAVQAGHVRRLGELVPSTPGGLVALVERAMLPEREARFESAADMRLALATFAGELSHAGRLAATAEPLPPLSTPVSVALLTAASPALPGVPKTVYPDAPLSVSQLGAARTSVSDGPPPMSQLPMSQLPMSQLPRPVSGTELGGPPVVAGALPQFGSVAPSGGAASGPPPAAASPKRRSAGIALALLLGVLGGGGAVGYAAYRAAEHRRAQPPPLPVLTTPPAPLAPDTELSPQLPATRPDATVTAQPARPAPNRNPTRPSPNPPSSPASGGSSGTAGAANAPTFQLPFPIPSQIQIPTALPSTIQLPPGFPSVFPPGIPGLQPVAPTAQGAAPVPSAAPSAGSKR